MSHIPSDNDALVLQCREAADVAMEVRNLVLSELQSVAQATKIYTFKQRLKPASSIYKKVLRKHAEAAQLRNDNYDLLTSNDKGRKVERRRVQDEIKKGELYSPARVTDCFACRYVTLFQQQIPEIVRAVFDAAYRYNEKRSPLLKLEELVVYTSRRTDDKLSISDAVISAYNATKFARTPEAQGAIVKPDISRLNAYTSVHVTFSVSLILDVVGRGETPVVGSFEVQIRDIFEEGWGEIDHFVRYSEKDLLDEDPVERTTLDIVLRDSLVENLRNLKESVSSCGAIAGTVHQGFSRTKIEHPRAPHLERKSATSRDDDRRAILTALKDRATGLAIALIKSAYRFLSEADSASSHDEQISQQQSAAKALEGAIRALGPLVDTKLPKRAGRPISYFLKLELASSILSSGDDKQVEQARQIFSQVSAKFPRDPIPKFRLAGCLHGRKGDSNLQAKAIKLLESAASLVGIDKLTKGDHWIRIAVQIRLSHFYWKISRTADENGRKTEKEKNLLHAAAAALRGYEIWNALPQNIRITDLYAQYGQKVLSNLLYFTGEIVLCKVHTKKFTKARLAVWIDEFHSIKTSPYWEYFDAEDNLKKAYTALGKMEEARVLAESIYVKLKGIAEIRAGENLNLGEIVEFLYPSELGAFNSAVRTLTQREDP